MAKLGVRLEVTEKILNHVSGSTGGIVGVYMKYNFESEMRDDRTLGGQTRLYRGTMRYHAQTNISLAFSANMRGRLPSLLVANHMEHPDVSVKGNSDAKEGEATVIHILATTEGCHRLGL